ncbi:MAG: LytTR family transcriptional regulator [Tannerellaceae bacterium]|nr:LytTR family transcriptional regulator [Tannerellaceae bacterium]
MDQFAFSLFCLTGLESPEGFYLSLPIRLLTGLLAWIALTQWYDRLEEGQEVVVEMTETEEDIPVPEEHVLDRISVKDGSRIHIIHPDELLYIQACGDYVNLFTDKGQYVKEQTMKYLAAHLPSSFVRIHRSCIVNVEHILRIELFGKESYHVRLKNGTTLRASIAGYKLLKQHLNL